MLPPEHANSLEHENFAPYLQDLNPAQQEAVKTTEGPLLILAGAGTGKTRTLTARLAYLIHVKGVAPAHILAVTFTNKAAREMRERLEKLLNHGVEGLWIGTFHALCVRFLRRHAEQLNLHPTFTILNTDDQLRLLKQVSAFMDLDEKKWPARLALNMIGHWKDRALAPHQITQEYLPFSSTKEKSPFPKIYALYQERLQALNAVDFGDLLMLCIQLFTKNPDLLKRYQTVFSYLMVDEYQDTNVAQYIWLRLLAQGHSNLCCVGDEDQSIYGWRGAEITNILKFEKDFPGAKVVRLEQNYRSTAHILGAASGLIAHNQARLGKTLWTHQNTGTKVTIKGLWDGETEARYVADAMENLHTRGVPLSQMVVLVRAGFQTREFEERFLTLGMPYNVVGGSRFYERQEIRDALAYLRLVIHPSDDLAFERILNTPRRGIGTASVQRLHTLAREANCSLYAAAWELTRCPDFKGKGKSALLVLLQSLERWRGHFSQGHSPSECAQMVLEESGYTAMLKSDKSPEAPGRLENLKELITALKEYETLASFLDHISLVMENTQNAQGETVTLMTLHGVKGLEFDHVFLAGWEEELFPHARALRENGEQGLEEERRLAYVGLTRARRAATITYASSRRLYGRWTPCVPSRFIQELPPEHVQGDGIFSNVEGQRGSSSFLKPSNLTPSKSPLSLHEPRESSWAYEHGKHAPPPLFQTGERVFHEKFGYGCVQKQEGEKVLVFFDHGGTKHIMANFLRKKIDV